MSASGLSSHLAGETPYCTCTTNVIHRERHRTRSMDMAKTGYITARVEPKLRAKAGRVLARVGMSTTDAITMFLTQVVLTDGSPFDVRVPKAETRKAIAERESGGVERFDATMKEFVERARTTRQKRRV